MKLKDIYIYILSDLYRYTGKIGYGLLLRNCLLNRGFKYTFWMRLCRTELKVLRFLAKGMHWRLSRKYLIQIPHDTEIGYGLYLGHHMCVVVNATAILGNNVNLSQFTTIGSNNGKAARIGSNVYIGPGCCLVENIEVGDNSVIGAGSVVVKDVAPNTIVAGVPAIYLKDNVYRSYVDRRWK